jgi:ligand-binding sensor domain-containing protein
MRILLHSLLLLIIGLPAVAQPGHYYISHYSQDRQAGALSFDMTQDANGLMYFASRKGLTQFDGHNWRTIATPSIIYSLSTEGGQVFASGEGVIGQVITAPDYSLQLKPIVSTPGIDYFESVSNKGTLFFITENELIAYQVSDKKIGRIKLPAGEEGFSNLFELSGNVYVATFSGKNYKVEGANLVNADLGSLQGVDLVLSFNENYFVVTEDQKYYLANGTNSLKEIVLNDAKYLQSGVVVSGAWVNDKLIALGTLNGGVVFIDPQTGKTEEIINYYSGLPDNEVYCMRRDSEGNVWVGHEYGFSCIAPELPFRSFNHYTGLSGNILCAKTFNDKVFVGTSVGLFTLTKEDQYMDEVYFVEKKGTVTKQVAVVAQEVPEQNTKRKGLFGSKRKKEKTETKPTTEEQTETVITKIRQVRKVLMGSTYSFKKVEGIQTKIEKLVDHNGSLYASGLSGLFKIEGIKAKPLVQEPVEVIASSTKYGIVGETYRGRVFSWTEKGETTLIGDIHDDISSFVEDAKGTLWITGSKTLYGFANDKTLKPYSFTNPALDHSESIKYKEAMLLVNTNGFYTVNGGAVRVIDTLGKPSQFFATGDNLWYRYKEMWRCLGSFENHQNLEYLNVFAELRYIDAEEGTDALWVVTKDNELFRFYSNKSLQQANTYPFLIRSIRNQQSYFPVNLPFYKLEQDGGQLNVEIVQATFGSQLGAQYRYTLEGSDSDDGWSDWTSNNVFSFPYLALGNYTLKFQTRDALGRISELESIRVRINPPFWKTPWFYAMEFAVFSVLVVLSMRLQALNNRYRLIAQMLSMLTIVLLITLIQAAVGTYFVTTSPVMDFGLQVGIAFLVLPVEMFLRKVMFSTNEKNKLYQIINPSLRKPTTGDK